MLGEVDAQRTEECVPINIPTCNLLRIHTKLNLVDSNKIYTFAVT